MEIICTSPGEAVVRTANLVVKNGSKASPRGEDTLEVLDFQIRVEEPWHIPYEIPGRNLKNFIGAVEALQLVGQVTIPRIITDGASVFERYMDDGILHGAYGSRIHGSLSSIVSLLNRDPSSRQAVLTIYSSANDLDRQRKDIPCTLSIQFFCRDGKLLARTSMRSNDVFLGLPYDLVQFIALQSAVATALDLPLGAYSHAVGSMHAYTRDLENLDLLGDSDSWGEQPGHLWSGSSIGEIVDTSMNILLGRGAPDQATEFERFLADEMSCAYK